jgi:hypothetical protein
VGLLVGNAGSGSVAGGVEDAAASGVDDALIAGSVLVTRSGNGGE